jgi:hypothetical protein
MKKYYLPLLILAGCASESPAPQSLSGPLSLSVYIAKSTLLRTPEFEQHVIKGDKVFSECGVIQGGKVQAREQKVSGVPENQLNKIKKSVAEIQHAEQIGELKFKPLSTESGFFDEGRTIITINSDNFALSIKTTLNAISSPFTPQEQSASELVRKVRKASATTCGTVKFFGVPKG